MKRSLLVLLLYPCLLNAQVSKSVFINYQPQKSTEIILNTQNEKEITESIVNQKLNAKFSHQLHFSLFNKNKDLENPAYYFIQKFNGIPVYGAEVILNLNDKNQVKSINGNLIESAALLNTNSSLTLEQGVQIVQNDLSTKTHTQIWETALNLLLGSQKPKVKTTFYPVHDSYKLAIEVTIRPNASETWKYWVDANSGDVLNHFKIFCSADGDQTTTAVDLNGVRQTLRTFLENNEYFMVDASKPMFNPQTGNGIISTLTAQNTPIDELSNSDIISLTSANNQWTDRSAVSAHFNAALAYDYFYYNHKRNSIDGNGGSIFSVVNITASGGDGYENAFWSGNAIFYGNGGLNITALAGALDVAGHEMSHGVIQHTADLEYSGESGALNESFADVFGNMMQPADWQIGEDVVNKPFFSTGALRDMSNPHNGGTSISDRGYQPDHTDEQYRGSLDNGGVHINSGITNHAFYKLATKTSRYHASQVFYHALTHYLTTTSDFRDLRIGAIQSGIDLFGVDSEFITPIKEAFSEVGIIGDPTNFSEELLAPIYGQEFLLLYNTDAEDTNTLYRISGLRGGMLPLTSKKWNSKPSINETGNVIVNVTDSVIVAYRVDERNNISTEIIDNTRKWKNAVISKDGLRIAALLSENDTAIHIYDMSGRQWMRFPLTNPHLATPEDGKLIATSSLQWGLYNQKVYFDAKNTTTDADNATVEYWDLFTIDAWDTTTNTKDDGSVTALFDHQYLVHRRNLNLSHNAPNIFVYDEYTPSTTSYQIKSHNLENNVTVKIIDTEEWAVPSYSGVDSRIFYNATEEDKKVVKQINLGADKQTPYQNSSTLYIDATLATAFIKGKRAYVGIENHQSDRQQSVFIYPNPSKDIINIQSISKFENIQHIELLSSMGKVIVDQKIQDNTFNYKLDITDIDKGVYFLRININNSILLERIVKN